MHKLTHFKGRTYRVWLDAYYPTVEVRYTRNDCWGLPLGEAWRTIKRDGPTARAVLRIVSKRS